MATNQHYDVVIVGAGVSGALIAKQLGAAGKSVLLLEAGEDGQLSNAESLERFYTAQAKVPESPYSPPIVTPDAAGIQSPSNPDEMTIGRATTLMLDEANWQKSDQAYMDQQGPLAFASTYERIGGGTGRHWLGTSFRLLPNDFKMKTVYDVEEDWPISYDDLEVWYGKAEHEIGVAANAADQGYHGITFAPGYNYPMPQIPDSLVDAAVEEGLSVLPPQEGIKLGVTNTPAARNSVPFQNRRQCAGNTNCIPICPIQAKWDPTVTLYEALQNPHVAILYKTVAKEILIGDDGNVSGISYLQYETLDGGATGNGTVSAERYIIAAHAIETPRLLLMSTNGGKLPNGAANSSLAVGKHLMDHPIYLSWAQTAEPVYGYRGPLSTAGIETMRDGTFRSEHAAFRIEIGNEGWNFPIGDPYTSTLDFVLGTNISQLNQTKKAHFGTGLVAGLNQALISQFRLGFLVEQTPEDYCAVSLSDTYKDKLGLPRPRITYDLSDYTKMGFVAAKKVSSNIYGAMGAEEFTTHPTAKEAAADPSSFSVTYDAGGKVVPEGTAGATTDHFRYFGAGHIVGTYRMGDDPKSSVVNWEQRSWDHKNMFLVGSGVFPTVATGNPTLTIAALALWAADIILADLE
ncbi:GMC family oxidoreductase [Pontixanthobacter gangjinensis]|uniref:GMC family oxidoreductase n=1 Tax=Pontixanthobacter gangjinensis TaxID=1028742 RepID=A0A6I4SHW6_9SPHN|nr:GMC family oxidoreductase [Pontixanthobacter gangjinensis]MXO55341.1 GMC family oxidoreductase [Pontixanthobacter gangjinensis]